jgi:hypothetical protein
MDRRIEALVSKNSRLEPRDAAFRSESLENLDSGALAGQLSLGLKWLKIRPSEQVPKA